MSIAQLVSAAVTVAAATWIVVGVLGYRRRIREARRQFEASDPPHVN